ncbi:MAG: PEGA domain-containing protein [Vicinamibacterales bacterium]
MNAAPNLMPDASQPPAGPQARQRQYTPGRSDGLGDRFLTFDSASAQSFELLRLKPDFASAPGFEDALKARVEVLGRLHHPSLTAVRGVERMPDGNALALVSSHVAGRRLSELVPDARGAAFALELVKQLAPALAHLAEQGPGFAHGALTADRVVVTREGRLVILEHSLGSALATLKLPADRLRAEIGIAVPEPASAALEPRGDVIQLGFIALSLLLGRQLDPTDYPANVPTLLDAFTSADAEASARLRPWLESALQIGRKPFASAREANEAFGILTGSAASRAAAPRPAPAPAPAAAAKPSAADAPARPAEGNRPVLTFQKPGEPAASSPIRFKPEPAPEPVVPEPDDETAEVPARSGMGRIVRWAAVALGLAAVVEGAIIANMYITNLSAGPAPVAATEPAAPPQPELNASVPPPVAPDGATPTGPGATDGTPTTLLATSGPAAGTGAAGSSGNPGPAGTTEPPATDAGATPAPAPAPRFGGVTVTAPIDLQVYQGDELIGSTAGPVAIAAGSHTLRLVNETLGYDSTQTVDVRSGQMATLKIEVPNGRISINAVPWAEVWIDGNPAGQTPLANLSIPIGKHEIVFRHPQFGEQKQTTIVKVEGLTRVSAVFQQ